MLCVYDILPRDKPGKKVFLAKNFDLTENSVSKQNSVIVCTTSQSMWSNVYFRELYLTMIDTVIRA